ncbi:MAG: YceI family protein [Acidimicrobiales bacterium]
MNKKYLAGGALVVVIAVAVAAWFVFFKDDAPDAATNDAANDAVDQVLADAADTDDAVTDDADAGADPAGDEPAPAVDGIDGVWVIDDEFGELTFESATGSFAGFRVAEELTVGEVTAVGRSGDVNGSVTIADGTLTGAEVTVGMDSIISNDSRRESAIRRAVNASEFPDATFTFDGGVDVSAIEVGGASQTFTIEGDLTVAGVTNPATFTIDANVRDDGFGVIVGSTEIVWEDFGVTPPSAPIVVSIADEGTVEFQLIVAR